MALDLTSTPLWLSAELVVEDDTEESVVGSDNHQDAIEYAHGPLVEYAREQDPDSPRWYVSNQVMVLVDVPQRSTRWRCKPDLFVVPNVPVQSRSSYDTRSDGPMPPFIVEVASEGTWERDVGEKQAMYSLAGVQEYLVFDPTSGLLGEPLRAWHRVNDELIPWAPTLRGDGAAVWESAVLGLAVRPEGLVLRFDHPMRGPLPLLRDMHIRLAAEQQAREVAEKGREAAEHAREAAEHAKIETEARAHESERHAAALEEELRRLRGHPPETESEG